MENKKMKKLLALMLAGTMTMGMGVTAFAQTQHPETQRAQENWKDMWRGMYWLSHFQRMLMQVRSSTLLTQKG